MVSTIGKQVREIERRQLYKVLQYLYREIALVVRKRTCRHRIGYHRFVNNDVLPGQKLRLHPHARVDRLLATAETSSKKTKEQPSN